MSDTACIDATLSLASAEPVGIVIADGGRRGVSNRFSAYVWGPGPEDREKVVGERGVTRREMAFAG